MDKLTAIKTFLQVVESEGFTKASEVLQIPKARVSQRINDLEEDLGIRLLHRTTRAIALTEDGRSYYEKCKNIFKELNEVESTLKGENVTPTGVIKVEILSSIAHHFIVPNLHYFHKKYPNVSVKIGSSDQVKNLIEEGIDCAIRGGNLNDSSLISKTICSVKMGLYASPAFLKKTGLPKSPTQLTKLPRIGWYNSDNMNSFEWEIIKGSNTFKLDSAPVFEFNDPTSSLIACLNGLGVGIAAPFTVHDYVKKGELLPVLPEWHFQERPLQIIYPSRKHLSVKVRSFVDWSYELLKQDPVLKLSPLELSRKFSK